MILLYQCPTELSVFQPHVALLSEEIQIKSRVRFTIEPAWLAVTLSSITSVGMPITSQGYGAAHKAYYERSDIFRPPVMPTRFT